MSFTGFSVLGCGAQKTDDFSNNNFSSQSTSESTSSDEEGKRMVYQTQENGLEIDPISNLFNGIVGMFYPFTTWDMEQTFLPTTPTRRKRHFHTPKQLSSTKSTSSDSEFDVKQNPRKHKKEENHPSKERKFDEIRGSNSATQVAQYKINFICSCLHKYGIKNRQDLSKNFDKVIKSINKNPRVFKSHYTKEHCFEIFQQALLTYNRVYDLKIIFSEGDVGSNQFNKKSTSNLSTTTTMEIDDLSRITRSYDRFVKSREVKKSTNEGISKILKNQEFAICSHVILGAGDTGVTVWLEKHTSHHGKTEERLSQGEFPDVLMIAENSGCWSHDYALAQPHSFLERADMKWNPSDYVTVEKYDANAFVNARHVYQANQVILAKTQAPLLTAAVTSIERKSVHSNDWKCANSEYRLVITTLEGQKTIYTNEIDICTGLGPSRKISDSIISKSDFDSLSKFDESKKYTPIVDGNKFMLTDSEEHCTATRSIVVYGGGGTASACYRKGFFGQDKEAQFLEFSEKNRKNSVIWIARVFDTVGNGRLASRSIDAAKSRNEMLTGNLQKITVNPVNGKLKLEFKSMDPDAIPSIFEVECDQFVYSIGQDDVVLKQASKEFQKDLQLDYDFTSGVPIGSQTKNEKIHSFGSASMAIGARNYADYTGDWLKKENIGPDVGAGTMVPSRAQIRQHVTRKNDKPITGVNVNSDTYKLIEKFLDQAGVNSYVGYLFRQDLVEARKNSGFDLNRVILQGLLDKHNLNGLIKISGHGCLVKK